MTCMTFHAPSFSYSSQLILHHLLPSMAYSSLADSFTLPSKINSLSPLDLHFLVLLAAVTLAHHHLPDLILHRETFLHNQGWIKSLGCVPSRLLYFF